MTIDSHHSGAAAGVAQADGRPWGARVVICGAGNIGSHAVYNLISRGRSGARPVTSLCLIDRGNVEARNTVNQCYQPDQVGRAKAHVMAELVRRIAPGVEVEAVVAPIEDVPLGVIAGADVLIGAVDSLRPRQVLSELAFRRGIPLVDGAVDGTGEPYGTVQVFFAGGACIECKWGSVHYRQLGREMPCGASEAAMFEPNRASAQLGAYVAGLMVGEALRILPDGEEPRSYEIAVDIHHGRKLVSRLSRASACRFDHQIARERVALGRPFTVATVEDLRQAALDWGAHEQPQLEFRRSILGRGPWAPSRWQTPDSLLQYAGRLLGEIGLSALDWIQLKTPSRRAFLELDARLSHKQETHR